MSVKQPVNPNDKRVIFGDADINQLAPFKYEWAWQAFLDANANHWTPLEVPMSPDISDWKTNKLTESEKHMFKTVLAYLTTSDIVIMRNIALALMEIISAPELQIYLMRQGYEESLHCYSEDTKVLTSSGWKYFYDLTAEDYIAQVDDDSNITFTKHLGVTKDFFEGDLIQLESKAYKVKVTPNHKCVYKQKNSPGFKKQLASDLTLYGRTFPVSGKALGFATSLTPIDRLKIAFQADGSFREKGKVLLDGTICYYWRFKKARKINRFLKLLKELPYRYELAAYEKETVLAITMWIPAETPLIKTFDWVNLAKVSYNYGRNFIAELAEWDGSTQKKSLRYFTSNKRCVDQVLALAPLCGYRAKVTTVPAKNNSKIGYHITFNDKQSICGDALTKTIVPYKGFVYSVGVPTTLIITKVDNYVSIGSNTWTYQNCIENLSLDQGEVYNLYRTVPALNAKIELSGKYTSILLNAHKDYKKSPELHSDNVFMEDILHDIVKGLVFYYIGFEGGWFYNGFTPIFSLQRRGLMLGTGEQFQYIMRDESMHASIGTRIIKTIISENSQFFTNNWLIETVHSVLKDVVKHEIEYAKYAIPNDIFGYNWKDHVNQLKYVLNNRAAQLYLKTVPFPEVTIEPYPWLNEQIFIRKEKNFFETRVTEYRSTGLNWDE